MPAPAAVLTLADLLDQRDLGLRLAAGDRRLTSRPVVGVHVVDVPHPGPWVEGDWLALTTGVFARDDPSAFAAFVDELAAADVAGIGFGLEPVFGTVPAALLRAARRHRIPVVAVPGATPFSEIVERVFQATLLEHSRASERLLAMQRFLLDALGEPQPRQAVIGRLATLVGGDVALLTREGGVDCATRPLAVAELWQELAARATRTLELEHAGRTWIAVPVPRGAAVHRWLVVASGDPRLPSRAVKAAARGAVPLLQAIDCLEQTRRGQERADRSVALDRLLSVPREALARPHLRELGFDTAARGAALVVDAPAGGGGAALTALEDALEQTQLAFVAREEGERVVAVVEGSGERLTALARGLADADPQLVVGLGSVVDVFDEAVRSYREAVLAVQHRRARRAGGVQAFADVGPTTAILAEIPPAATRRHATSLLERIAGQPEAMRTLETYFAHRLSVTGTAERLHLHPNSLRYRLTRIEELIGASLRDPATIAAVYLALRALAEGAESERLEKVRSADAAF